MTLVMHANWTAGSLHIWAESADAYRNPAGSFDEGAGARAGAATLTRAVHPFAIDSDSLRQTLNGLLTASLGEELTTAAIHLRLPATAEGPRPSDRFAGILGIVESDAQPWLETIEVPTVAVLNGHALEIMLRLAEACERVAIACGHSFLYWTAVARFATELLVHQRFIPTLLQSETSELQAHWQPWLHDKELRTQVGAFIASMPPAVRAVVGASDHEVSPFELLDEALRTWVDQTVRRFLIEDDYADAIEDRDPSRDAHVAWLSGLLADGTRVQSPAESEPLMIRNVGRWVASLDDRGEDRPLHLGMRLIEPPTDPDAADQWRLAFFLYASDQDKAIVPAEELWSAGVSQLTAGVRPAEAQELLLTELTRASRVFPKLETALSSLTPSGIELSTIEAHDFLRTICPILEESRFRIDVPDWWHDEASRLGVRLHIDAPTLEEATQGHGGSADGRSLLGLDSLVDFQWQLAMGDVSLTHEQFRQLVERHTPLQRFDGRWIELRADDLEVARRFFNEPDTGQMTLRQAVRLAYDAEGGMGGLPVVGLRATGWVEELLNATTDQSVVAVPQPAGFKGSLRPYQLRGLSWMVFLDRFGLGGCLADDMGLGKTIQLIALLLHEREQAPAGAIEPTLLVIPTSLIANWSRELERFAPSLKAHVQHGPTRPLDDAFTKAIEGVDVVITTYALVSRDRETLTQVSWRRVALDEAQYIKNPPTKQTSAIRALRASSRFALTGTPVENRLTELWSIMEFCNPGYLGPAQQFRKRFAIPIERRRDRNKTERLRGLVQPFILRRLKTDPTVIDDLPSCVETKEYATLTAEQASMYESTVKRMLGEVDRADGIRRRGLVLSTLVKLKQICNHPLQFEPGPEQTGRKNGIATDLHGHAAMHVADRSGKCKRLIAMLEEILASDGKALVFTQFRQMGHLLQAIIRQELDTDVLFLHGGTPAHKRQELIDRFQATDGGVPVFVLSLKAGGVGLNLTAANHVVHFDRWWNPAVENQATDRAFRIGQMRKVQVHKFVCTGTLEERIDQMIERKTELAENIIGAGESWVTELTTTQLRDIFALRSDAVEVDA